MAKMTSHSKEKLYTSTLVFVRQENLSIATLGIATVVTAKKISVQTAMKKLEAAVSDWVKHTQSGRECYEYSGGKITREVGSKTTELCGGDLNIGDLALYEREFTTGTNTDYLRKQGILDFNIQYVGDLSEGTFDYDRVLAK